MDHAGAAITAEYPGQPGELYRFEDGQTGQDGAEAHEDYAGVGDLLRAVIFQLRGRCFADMEVVQNGQPGFPEGMPVGKEVAPLAGDDRVRHVYEAVEEEYPHENKMKGH